MEQGGLKTKRKSTEILRLSGLVMPIGLIGYGLLMRVPSSGETVSIFTFLAIMIPWVLLGLFIFLIPAKSDTGIRLRLIGYHAYAGAYILLIENFSIPFVTLGWLLLLLVSYIYLSSRGLIINLLFLLGISLADILKHPDDVDRILINIIAVFSISVIGTIVITLSHIQQDDSEALIRSQAEESLQRNRLNTLINSLADAVIGLDENGKIEIYNAASLDLLNTNENLYGRFIDEIIQPRNQSGKSAPLFKSAQKARRVHIRDDLSVTIDDEVVRLGVTSSPIRGGFSGQVSNDTPDGYVLILRDITKSKSLEEERDEFISVVSHELRTPITIAEGTLSNIKLMMGRDSTPPGALERNISSAHTQVLFLSKMVNDLSTLSRAERGIADSTEEIDIKKLVSGLYNEYTPQAEKKGLRFDIDTSGKLGTVTTSHLYLQELLQNLITNAIKYTKEGSVVLRVKRNRKSITFEVKDTGIGISKSDQSRIFDKFYRSEDYRTRETGGTGLGLYVTAKLARKLGTSISVKSRLNHGSAFSFTMPLDEE